MQSKTKDKNDAQADNKQNLQKSENIKSQTRKKLANQQQCALKTEKGRTFFIR